MRGDDETSVNEVREWLTRSGHPLEMRVARSFRTAGFRVESSEYYVDPDTEKVREIDLVASWPSRREGRARVVLVVECKAGGCPVVALEGDRKLAWSENTAMRVGTPTAQEFLKAQERNERVLELPLLDGPSRVSYRLVEKRKSGDNEDRAYQAMQVLSKAAAYEVEGHARDRVHIVLHVLIVDAPLMSAHLDDGLQLDISPVDRHRVIWKGTPSHGTILVDVVAASALDSYCRAAIYSVRELVTVAETWLPSSVLPVHAGGD